MIRGLTIALLLIILIIGTLHTGHGAWIYIKAELAQHLLEQAWKKTKKKQQPVPPWPWADTWPIAKLFVPQHHIEMIVLSGASGRTLAFGPGHVSSSAMPGFPGTTILNGHRDTHFTFLEKLQVGDVIIIEASDKRQITFRVSDLKVVDSRKTVILHDDNISQLALLTCYPFNAISPGGPLRYLVIGERQ